MNTAFDQRGVTLVETLVATAVFAVVALALYATWSGMFTFVSAIRTKTVLTEVVSQRIEFIRNLPYSDVGTVYGIPSGVIPATETVVRNGVNYELDTTIRNIDNPADGTLGSTPNDLSPADNKLVQIVATCTSCAKATSITYTSLVAPKNLETENGNGALVIKAINASGQPVPGAVVSITNTALTPAVAINDVTDAAGVLTIVDAPPSTQQYKIVVTKDEYSTEETYPFGDAQNPNPTKPHLTVTANTISQDTFAIDQLSTITVRALSPQCAPIVGVGATLAGTKLIGAPSITKNNLSLTTGVDGSATNGALDWDTYTLSITDALRHLVGLSTSSSLAISPGTTQTVTALLSSSSGGTLAVAPVDLLGAPLSGATVTLTGSSDDRTHTTGVGYVEQSDWSGGPGATTFDGTSTFFSSDGGIEYSATSGLIRLKSAAGSTYVPTGELISSTIDLGEGAVPSELLWTPLSQPAQTGATPVAFQVAANTDALTWNFVGPDGTANTSYTSSSIPLGAFASNRYFRYKVIFSTEDISSTPSVSDIAFQYTNACTLSGTTSFEGVANGTYTLTVSKSGFATTTKSITIPSTTYETITLTAQ